jgi:DNA-binding IclR family transcriptional regulator
MSSLERLLSILDLYSEEDPIWTLEGITLETGYTRSTAYRYVKELNDAGLLISIGKGAHVLGPRIIEFDRLIRNTDPLLIAAQKIMPSLHRDFGEGLMLLSSLYGNKVLCIHQEPLNTDLSVSYTRGRPMPLFYGATAKIILAHLPERKLVRLFVNHHIEISKSGMGNAWDEFRSHLELMRRQRYCVSVGEVDPGIMGIGTAIFANDNSVIGSLTHVVVDTKQKIDSSVTECLIDGCDHISSEVDNILQNSDDANRNYTPVMPYRKARF